MPDYKFYRESFFGDKIPEEEFSYFAHRAAERVRLLTLGRCEEGDENTRLATCAVAELLFETDGRTGLTSESSDGFSANYTSSSSEILAAAAQFLPFSLFYRGC